MSSPAPGCSGGSGWFGWDLMRLPDRSEFPFWDDATPYRTRYHVAAERPEASDANPGTEGAPWATIGRAAEVLGPGEQVIVHAGVYREWINPRRGGDGADAMIAYAAAPGERVVIKGSEVWDPPGGFVPSRGWKRRGRGGLTEATIWTAPLPREWFAGYQPFLADNMPGNYRMFVNDWRPEETHRFQLKRGLVFADGVPLRQVMFYAHLCAEDAAGGFWVDDGGLAIHFRLENDRDPNSAETTLEVTAREQVFAPERRNLGYIRVSGFVMEHAADPVPWPQRALVSTTRGHHWIIEENRIRHANSTGLDLGLQSFQAEAEGEHGSHIVRRNTIEDCGVSGIQGVGGVDHSLIEDNRFERIGGRVPERIWECAAVKFHRTTGVLIRRNLFRRIRRACGLWLDVSIVATRVTGNVFTDITSCQAAVYIEVSPGPNLVDGNVIWKIRSTLNPETAHPKALEKAGLGVFGDSGENLTVAHNLFGEIRDNYAVSFDLHQEARITAGRVGLGRGHRAMNNLFYACPRRILFGQREENAAGGNVFDARDDDTSFCIRYPTPSAALNLTAWRDVFGFDRDSVEATLEVAFHSETFEVRCAIDREAPDCAPVEGIETSAPGRFR